MVRPPPAPAASPAAKNAVGPGVCGMRRYSWMIAALLALPTATPSTISVRALLSTCCDACALGCAAIRDVQAQRSAGDALRVRLKTPNDPRSALTEADAAAQRVIVGALLHEWPGLRIVGEEDVLPLPLPPAQKLRRDLCVGCESDVTAELADITLYVDPLDGTREFVEQRLQNCQVLVGVAVRGRAVAGAVGVPFPSGDLRSEATIVYGLVGAGAGTLGPMLARPFILRDASRPRPFVATGDTLPSVMEACAEVRTRSRMAGPDPGFRARPRPQPEAGPSLEPEASPCPLPRPEQACTEAALREGGSRLIYGGAGNKILAAAIDDVDVTVQHKFGGPWDTCASEAVLTAMGGRLTDLYGEPLSVYEGGPEGFTSALRPVLPGRRNELGFVATGAASAISHDELIRRLGRAVSNTHGCSPYTHTHTHDTCTCTRTCTCACTCACTCTCGCTTFVVV